VTVDGGAGRRVGAGGVTVDAQSIAEQSGSLISFSFPYPTGAMKEMDVDIVIKTSGRRIEVYCAGMHVGS
jgi:hypothetical protein